MEISSPVLEEKSSKIPRAWPSSITLGQMAKLNPKRSISINNDFIPKKD